MSRRPSLISNSSSISTINLGNGRASEPPPFSKKSSPPSHTITPSNSISKVPIDSMDPDELFRKHNIAEIKLLQRRLRTDADAKQEELRLMVGERYRDLLQASTSIISMANSSQRVIKALEETKAAILAERPPSVPKYTSIRTNEDNHLQALQVLAAHIKLLLDAPEHLWRMLEKKKYFSAAWLYLLSRVVHRALVHQEQDEEAWHSQGADVLESFPLVQRQWEVVAQFRAQIVHKATLFLRDFTASAQDICATLLSLHLLDSRPLSDTLVTLLGQRSKSLQAVLSKTPTPQGSIRELKSCIVEALDSISQTVGNSRDVFQSGDLHLSLIRATLEFIQTDAVSPGLPQELQLTTQTLLDSLSSSSQLSVLPQNLRLYKPHVDVNSQFSSLPLTYLDQRVSEWFHKSTDIFQRSCQMWLLDAHSVKVVWSIRRFVCSWLQSSVKLKDSEMSHIKSLFEDVFRERIVHIWETELSGAEQAFRKQLTSAVTSVKSNPGASPDISPVTHLFDAPSLPTISQQESQPLQKYRASLHRQLMGRVFMLDNVLKTLEKCAATLQEDLQLVLGDENSDTLSLIAQLKESYEPLGQKLCSTALANLEALVDTLSDETELDISALVFVGRIAEELSVTSPFIPQMSFNKAVTLDFQQKASSIYERVIERWRECTILRILSRHRVPTPFEGLNEPCTGPSNNLVESLLALADSILDLGMSREAKRHVRLADRTVHLFISRLLDREWEYDRIQKLHDMIFLRKISELWGPGWGDVQDSLDAKISRIRESNHELPTNESILSRSADYLAKSQTILASALPPKHPAKSASLGKFAALLPLGVPLSDQESRVAVETARPSMRFAMLLVN
ncbi:hypothetical protein D9757_004649 [Collybiopsis confluens]|uniref:Conserved oligomeric Golgi complex subunit 1 n=1 Tax=Collybiopsis confluens TaxID=2823264 RepID=A0A8H5MC71_9AGAR|nr:hypothetical protein D9757_004649 [Collybiopsis confluens]